MQCSAPCRQDAVLVINYIHKKLWFVYFKNDCVNAPKKFQFFSIHSGINGKINRGTCVYFDEAEALTPACPLRWCFKPAVLILGKKPSLQSVQITTYLSLLSALFSSSSDPLNWPAGSSCCFFHTALPVCFPR